MAARAQERPTSCTKKKMRDTAQVWITLSLQHYAFIRSAVKYVTIGSKILRIKFH